MAESLLLKNALRVVLMDDARTELSHSDVLIRGREIAAVDKDIQEPGARVLDAADCVVLPGFVNTHHHLCQTLTRAIPAVQNSKLFDWLAHLYGIWRHLTPKWRASGPRWGWPSFSSPVRTTTADHTYLFPAGRSNELIDRQIEAAQNWKSFPSDARLHVGRAKRRRTPAGRLLPERRLDPQGLRTARKSLSRPEALLHVARGVAPCAPYSVNPNLVKHLAAEAKRWGVRLHTHIAETLDEETYCLNRYKMRPLDFIESVGWLEGNAWLAHMVHVLPDKIKRLAKSHTGIAHCPSSNLRLGSGIAPIREHLDAGVPVGLGVNGLASNDSGDFLAEVRQCMLLHRVHSGVHSMTARDALWMATRGGAEVLGAGHRLHRPWESRGPRRLQS